MKCPKCGSVQQSSTLAYFPDGVDRNRIQCMGCGHVLREFGETAMPTDLEINEAIARECGHEMAWAEEELVYAHFKDGKHWMWCEEPMSFCEDYNAIHDAETVIAERGLQRAYMEKLPVPDTIDIIRVGFALRHATARQCAEALYATFMEARNAKA